MSHIEYTPPPSTSRTPDLEEVTEVGNETIHGIKLNAGSGSVLFLNDGARGAGVYTWRDAVSGTVAVLSDIVFPRAVPFTQVSGASYAVQLTDVNVYYVANTGSECDLPAPSSCIGYEFTIKNIGSVATLAVKAPSGISIDFSTSPVVLAPLASVTVQSAGGQYFVL